MTYAERVEDARKTGKRVPDIAASLSPLAVSGAELAPRPRWNPYMRPPAYLNARRPGSGRISRLDNEGSATITQFQSVWLSADRTLPRGGCRGGVALCCRLV